ncbi:periaxin [Notechis scutatus]|uniref:Periaxin n=1 Tax=Notechis scutatus TaxID=8663 RepID=A0A6J1VKI8_9SAUR|nr:periaxin [Notechis scutatus]
MTAQFIAMEKTIAASELLEMVVETEAGAGARGLSVAGGGKAGLFVKDVLKDSPAARVLSLQEGDQLLSARVYFDNIKYEDALQILKCAEPYKISFCLKRVVPSADVSRQPGATVFEVRGPKAKLAKLNIQGLSSLKRKKKKKKKRIVAQSPAAGKPEVAPVDVEFSFPTFSKLRKARSAGEVAVAEASPGVSRKLSSLETKRHRLKFPRLKVKDAVAAEARLAMGLPHIGLALKEAGRGGGGGEEKTFRFTLPFSRAKKPKEEAGEERERGFQAPQVALALPLPKVGAEEEEEESLEAGPKGQSLLGSASRLGWPKVEAALPKGSASALKTPPGLLQAGLKLPAAEVAAPKVDVDLALPRLECAAAPEAAPKREGFRVKVPNFGVSAEEAELKLPLMKAPALEMALGGKSREKVLEDQPRPAGAMPSLELPFPKKGKPGMESPEVSGGISLVSLPQLGGAGKLPQAEASLGKPGSPKADKAKGSPIQLPGLEISLREHPLESQEAAGAAGASQVKLPEVRVPSLDISAPKVQDIHLCKAMGEPAASSGRAKPKEAAEGAGIKFQVPQISLPKFDFPVKPAPSPPPVQVKMPKPEGDPGMKVSLPKGGDVFLLAMKVPGVQLPKVPRPELGISVEKPEVEVTTSPAPLSFPPATVPVLDIQLPKVGVELDLMKHERDLSEQGPKAQEVTRWAPSKDFQVEISLPKGAVSQPGLEPGMRSIEGPALAGMVAKFPKVDLAFEKQPADAEGPKTDLEGAKTKLPTVEIPPIGLPEMTTENQAKGKTSRFALSKFSILGPKVWSKMSPEVSVSGVEGREAADLGSKLKLPKFGIYFPKSKWEAEAEGAKLALEVEGEAPKERLGKTTESRMKLPTVEVDIGRPQGTEGGSDGNRGGASPEPLGVEFKGLKLSLPSFGGKGREEAWGALESGEVKWQDGKEGLTGQPDPRRLEKEAKASRFRIASFGLMRRDVETKGKAAPGSPKEKPKGPFGKMPQLKLSSLKVHLPAPEQDEKVLPQVELPRLAPRAETGLIPEPESPGFRVQVPSVEIAGPGSKAEEEAAAERPAGDTAVAEFQQQEGGLQGPQAPSIQVSAPTLELGIALPMAGKEEGVLQAAPGTGPKVKLPKVELAKLGKGQEEEAEAAVQLLGKEGEKGLGGAAEASALGTKVRLPKVDISLPKAWLPEVELPPAKVDLDLEGPEAKFKIPSMGLPKLSTLKVKAPELELDVGLDGGGVVPKVTAGTPSVKWPKFGASGSPGDGQGQEDLTRVLQLELKPPKFSGSTEVLGSEMGAKEGRLRVPTLPLGLGKLETEAGMGREESRVRLKLPSPRVSKPEAEVSLDTQPLCAPAEAFRVPQIALPDVSFSGDQERGEEAEAAGATDLEGGLEGMLKMPKIGITVCGPEATKWGTERATSPSQRGEGGGEPEGKKSVFKAPGLEISAPGLKAQAEDEVGGPHTRQRDSLDLEGTGREGWKQTDGHSDARKRHRVRIPTFGLFLPRVGLEAPEGLGGQEPEARGGLLALGRPKEAEGPAGLLVREEEDQAKAAKLKLRTPFGVSLSRPKGAAEFHGEAEGASSRLTVPKLGFSKVEGAAQLRGERGEGLLQDGASKLGKIPLPQVELLSPSKGAETDPELSLKLVKADEVKEGTHRGATIAMALKAAKFKPPRVALSGFKKHNGELAPEAVSAPGLQVGVAPLKTATKGEPSSKFRFPKLALSSRSQEVLEISKHQQDQGGGNFRLPAVAFSVESGSEEGAPTQEAPRKGGSE